MTAPERQADSFAECLSVEFRRRMLDEYVPRIRKCTELLTEDQSWISPGTFNNSVANLLMHLAGNVRQWIICGIGDASDERNRPFEFSGNRDEVNIPISGLMDRLEDTVREAVAIVEGLTPDQWLRRAVFQQRYDETIVGAVLHAMEHFSGHAGQIYAFTKQETGKDLKFYDL